MGLVHRSVTASALFLLVSACGGGALDPPSVPLDELSAHDGEFCPATLPLATLESRGFGTVADMDEPKVTVQVRQVDERTSRWEDPRPCFRVYLHGSGETTTGGWSDTYDITGADVLQVIDWAQRQAGDQLTYAVALVRDDAERERESPGYGRGLVWLVGADGNDNTEDDTPGRLVQQRMLLRRRSPVGIPETDRAPDDMHSPYSDGTKQP